MDADKLAEQMAKVFGENAEAQEVTDFLDTGSPDLNFKISGRYDGGLPYGRILEMAGPPSCGKTALATEWMVKTQQAGGVAGFTDWERSFDMGLAKQLGLLDPRPFWFYDRPKTWEEGNTRAAQACKMIRESGAIDKKAPILWVFDSIASALPQSMAEKDISEYNMNDTTALARVSSTTLKAINQYVGEFNVTFLYLNQIRTKPGVVYGDPTTTPGGSAMGFYASVRLMLGRKKLVDKDKEFIGQQIGIKVAKTKLTKPFQETTIDMRFEDNGIARFDMIGSTIDALIEAGKLSATNGRITWTDGKTYFKPQLTKLVEDNGGMDVLRPLFA